MASLDEMWFHQILGWHHFYDLATPTIGLMSDGFLHAFELMSLAGGFALVMNTYRRGQLIGRWSWAGFLIGMGGFQLLDGTFVHKVLRLHQIRYGVPILPYDAAWNGGAALLLLAGIVTLQRARRAG